MNGNRTRVNGPAFLLLLLLSFLIGCQGASNAVSDVENNPPVATENEPAHTPLPTEEEAPPTTTPGPTQTALSTARPTDVPTLLPTIAAEATTMTGAEQGANADVEFVRAVQTADGSWTFHVTVRHPDTGWEDYADGWDVVTADGLILKRAAGDPFTRLLLHPHESEQPFTRSQSGLLIPEGIDRVTVRAHDLVDGFGGRQIIVDLSVSDGPDFEVERQ